MSLKNFKYPDKIEAGCDEAGRGCLAGPVFAAAVILPKHFKCPELDDSKKLSKSKRDLLRKIIEEKAIAFCVAEISALKIDEINILQASILGMQNAVQGLSTRPDFILVDGNKFNQLEDIDHECIIKGDSIYKSIAAASILAKTYRDEYMQNLDVAFPHFDWKKNKGYPTKFHRKMIAEHGATNHHRMTFKLLPDLEPI
jgi:ribonuclease HII|tara:strand:+ start:3095 stop:3691 length:597 start_codon:yes stop_codon:yes gene_type:complete